MKYFLALVLVFFFFACDNKIVTEESKNECTLGEKTCDGKNLKICLIENGDSKYKTIECPSQKCDKTTNTCVECTENAHCENNQHCEIDTKTCEVNKKEVDCAGLPENASATNSKVEITWDETNNKWTEPALCEWTCNDGWEKNNNTCIDVDECQNNPCENGGTCNNEVGSYSCACNNISYGKNCKNKCGEHFIVNEDKDACICEDGYFKKGSSCIPLIECKIHTTNDFDGRLYLDIKTKLNSIEKVKNVVNNVQFWQYEPTNKAIDRAVIGPYEIDENGYNFRYYITTNFQETGSIKYYVKFEDKKQNNKEVKCDNNGSDNNDSTENSNQSYNDADSGEIKIDCIKDNQCTATEPPLCVYGKCEVKATGDGTCKEAEFKGHNYKFCKEKKTWDDAKTACGEGFQFVKIENAVENEWIKKNIKKMGDDDWEYWIGLNDIKSEANEECCPTKPSGEEEKECNKKTCEYAKTSSKWKWENEDSNLDPAKGGYNGWGSNQPNNHIKGSSEYQDCVLIINNKHKDKGWDDWYCSEPHYYICESETN